MRERIKAYFHSGTEWLEQDTLFFVHTDRRVRQIFEFAMDRIRQGDITKSLRTGRMVIVYFCAGGSLHIIPESRYEVLAGRQFGAVFIDDCVDDYLAQLALSRCRRINK